MNIVKLKGNRQPGYVYHNYEFLYEIKVLVLYQGKKHTSWNKGPGLISRQETYLLK